MQRVQGYLTSRKRSPLGPYSRTTPRALWWTWGGGRFLMGEVPLYPFRIHSQRGHSWRYRNLPLHVVEAHDQKHFVRVFPNPLTLISSPETLRSTPHTRPTLSYAVAPNPSLLNPQTEIRTSEPEFLTRNPFFGTLCCVHVGLF